MRRSACFGLGALVMTSALPSVSAAQIVYDIHILENFVPLAISDGGKIAGQSLDGDWPVAAMRLPSGSLVTLPGARARSSARGINDEGDVFGRNGPDFVLWTTHGATVVLENAHPPRSMNDARAIVGDSPDRLASRWRPPAFVYETLDSEGYETSSVMAINNHGWSGGAVSGLNGDTAVLWDADGRLTDLWNSGTVTDLNDDNDVVGVVESLRGDGLPPIMRPYRWDVLNGGREITVLQGWDSVSASNINDQGAILLSAVNYVDDTWQRREQIGAVLTDTELVPLPSVAGRPCTMYRDMNDHSDVIGLAWDCSSGGRNQTPGDAVYFLATPTGTLGDLSGDGTFDAFDVIHFEFALADPEGFIAINPTLDPETRGDMNDDWRLDAFDVSAFEALLAGTGTGGGATVPEPRIWIVIALGITACGRRLKDRWE